jgi:hypothetical protein
MHRDWIDYASAAGSIATAVTLIILLIREWKTRKDITDLSVIAKQLQKQNELAQDQMKLHAMPMMKILSFYFEKSNVEMRIENIGSPVTVTGYSFIGDVEFNPIVETILNRGKDLMLRGKLKREAPKDFAYTISIFLNDYFGNAYHLISIGLIRDKPTLNVVEASEQYIER